MSFHITFTATYAMLWLLSLIVKSTKTEKSKFDLKSHSSYTVRLSSKMTILSGYKALVLYDSVNVAFKPRFPEIVLHCLSFLQHFPSTKSAWGPENCLISYPTEFPSFQTKYVSPAYMP